MSFDEFTITINNDNSITITTYVTSGTIASNMGLYLILDNARPTALEINRRNTTQTITSGAAYNRIYTAIGNETSATINGQIFLSYKSNPSSPTQTSNRRTATATIPEYTLSGSASVTDTSANVQTTNYETQTIHYVSEFTNTPNPNTYLMGWSTPRIDYVFSSSTGALYGNKLTLTGAITGTADLGTTSLQLGTDFDPDTNYNVTATDGRQSVTVRPLIGRVYWTQPTISLNLSRYNSVGRQINWEINGNCSYSVPATVALNSKINLQLTYNGNTYNLYTKNSEYYWYDGTHLYKDTTGAEIGSFDISTYTLGIVGGKNDSTFNASGQFILIDEGDYKYSITASANFTDHIDYRVYANGLIPSGLPAIYVHKDSNSNNLVDIYGNLNVSGKLVATGGWENYSTNEIAIGTWVDGSTIYRQVFSVGSLPDKDNLLYSTPSMPNNCQVLKIYGTATKANTETFPMPFSWGDVNNIDNYISLFYDYLNKRIYIRTNRYMSTYTGIVIIEYTKN